MRDAEEILEFWFGPLDAGGFSGEHYRKRWFAGRRVDDELRSRFSEYVNRAIDGDLDCWRERRLSRMALILLLDQFTRNIFRGSAEAFSGDARALEVALEALDTGEDNELPTAWRLFFYLPLEHSEKLEHQDLALSRLGSLLREAPDSHRQLIRQSEQWARRHRAIIVRFGRFPHRNALLERQSTHDERAWLQAGGDRFGQ